MIGGSRPAYSRRLAPSAVPIVVYGTRWCAQTQQVRRYLDQQGVPYTYLDLERDPGAGERLRWYISGFASHPTIYIGGKVLVQPSIGELEWALAVARVRK